MTTARRYARPLGPRAPLRLAAALAALGLGLFAGPVGAEVRVRVDAEGPCPAPADLEREVSAWAAPMSDASAPRWRLRAIAVRGGARVELSDPTGRVVLVRSVASTDCQALARAFSLIAHAHFLELGLVRPLPPAPPPGAGRPPPAGTNPSPNGTSPAPPPGAPPAGTAAPPSSAAPVDPAAPRPPSSASRSVPPPPPPSSSSAAQEATQASRPPGSLALGLGPGLVLPLPTSAPPPLGFLDLTGRPSGWGFDLRLGGWLSALAPTGEQVSIRRRFGLVALTAGLPWGRRPWVFRPEIGPGLLWTSVDARATEAPGVSRLRATVRVGGGVSHELTKALSVRGDLALHVLPWTDRYVVSPLGEVGKGPRALVLLGVGLEGRTAFW